MSDKKTLILAAHSDGINDTWAPCLLERNIGEILTEINGARLWIGPRDMLEPNKDFRQVIPYIVLRVGNRLVKYTRAAAGGEAALHSKISVGVGGHIDLADICLDRTNNLIHLHETLDNAANREFNEEVDYRFGAIVKRWVGTIAHMDSDVARVHLGVVALWDIARLPGQKEDAVAELGLATLDELHSDRHLLEDWSKAVVDWLRTNPTF